MNFQRLLEIRDQLAFSRLNPKTAHDQVRVMGEIAALARRVVVEWKDGLESGFCPDEVLPFYEDGQLWEDYDLCAWSGRLEDLPFCEIGGWRLTNPEIRWEGPILALGDVPGYCGGPSDGWDTCKSADEIQTGPAGL